MSKMYFDPNGWPCGSFYMESVHGQIPDSAFEIDEQEYHENRIGKGLFPVQRDGAVEWVPKFDVMQTDVAKLSRERRAKADKNDKLSDGVTVMGIRFGGSDKERVDLLEALEYASDANLSVFPVWKDSDGQYHENVPVSAIQDAASQLRALRFQLISDEASEVSRIRKAKTKGEL